MIDVPCEITVPNLGEGVRYVVVKSILIKDGDWVDEDGGLIEVETDKSVVEIPSPVSGYIGGIQCKPGDVLPVGSRLLVVKPQADVKAPQSLIPKVGQMRKGDALKNKAVPVAKEKETRQQSSRQMALASRMQHSANIVVPAMVERQIVWDHIDTIKKYFRSSGM